MPELLPLAEAHNRARLLLLWGERCVTLKNLSDYRLLQLDVMERPMAKYGVVTCLESNKTASCHSHGTNATYKRNTPQ